MHSVPMPIVIEHDPTLVKLFVHGFLLVHPIRSSIQFGPYSCPLSKGKRESQLHEEFFLEDNNNIIAYVFQIQKIWSLYFQGFVFQLSGCLCNTMHGGLAHLVSKKHLFIHHPITNSPIPASQSPDIAHFQLLISKLLPYIRL